MIRVTLFGRFTAGSEKCQLTLRDGSKAQELLSYLLLNANRPHTRDAIASLLWSDCTTEISKAYLRKALWQLQSALEACERMSPPFLQLDGEWIQVHPDNTLWSDVLVFQRAYNESSRVENLSLGGGALQAMQQAVELYQGGVLPNRYESWCLEEQERHRAMYLKMRQKLLDYYVGIKNYEKAIEEGNQILRCDCAHERTHQRLMSLYSLQQDRTRALIQYRLCRAALAAELGVEPSKETTELYKSIRESGAPEAPLDGSPANKTDHLLSDSIARFQVRLRELSSSFTELEHRAEATLMELEKYFAGDDHFGAAQSKLVVRPTVRTPPDTFSQRAGTVTPLVSKKSSLR